LWLVGLLAFALAGFRRKTMEKRSYKAWSEYDDMTLIDLRDKKVSIRIISGVMQRTESSIHNRIALLKVGTKKKIKLHLEPEQKFLDKYIKWVDRMVFKR
jgi:hypothetical protein